MLCEKDVCTGCAACYAVCPFDAIKMIEDETGTLRPRIDAGKCRNCNLCSSVCPGLHEIKKSAPIECYAAYTKNRADRIDVASGGIATQFGKHIISGGGAVFGTIFNIEPYFDVAYDEQGVNEFKGSKYVYVFPDKIYNKVKEELLLGKQCLFAGTPCQVDGLKNFLGKEYDNLITVDIICHGTPPYTYLKQWIDHNVKCRYDRVTFRGVQDHYLTCWDSSGKIVYKKKYDEDVYFYSFENSLIQREVCYSCRYADRNRVSDLTIGDFWGLFSDALNNYNGRKSVILINTEKGAKFFAGAKQELECEKRTVEEAVNGNAHLSRPPKVHPKRSAFISYYKSTGDFVKSARKSGIMRLVRHSVIRNRILYIPRKIKHKLFK